MRNEWVGGPEKSWGGETVIKIHCIDFFFQ